MRILLGLSVLAIFCGDALATRRPVGAECRDVRLMFYLAAVGNSGLNTDQRIAINALRVELCLGNPTSVPQTRSWPNGRTSKDAHGQWYYPNGKPLRSVYRELLYPDGKTARTTQGDWNYPDGSRSLRHGVVEQWYRPGHNSALTLAELLRWATTRLQPEDFKEITVARLLGDTRLATAAVLMVVWRATKTRPRP